MLDCERSIVADNVLPSKGLPCKAADEVIQDQWQVQVQAQVQSRAEVYVKSSLDAAKVEGAMLRVCDSVEETAARLVERYGPDATICVLPEGPMTIPYLSAAD